VLPALSDIDIKIFLLAIVLSVILFTTSGYLFGTCIFNLLIVMFVKLFMHLFIYCLFVYGV
jgi:hypothetical protein